MEKSRFYANTEKGKDPYIDFNAAQSGGSHEIKSEQLEYWIAAQIGKELMRVYKNRQWGVDVDSRNKMVVLTAPSLSKVFGYHLHIRDGETMTQLLLRCRHAAGEILERYNVTRARNTDPLIIEEGLKRDHRDNVISADAAPEKAVIENV
jgi:hypothetical protein